MENKLIRSAEEKDKSRNAKLLESVWAYTLLSWLMATVPAILLVPKLYGDTNTTDETNTRIVQFIVISLCSVAGAVGGILIGLFMTLARQKNLTLPTILAPFFGVVWGIIIGGLGGFPIFFIGGFILGWMFAVPVGFVGFTLFGVVYEPLTAHRRLHWWQIILIEIGVLILLLGFFYLLESSYSPL